MDSHSLGLPDVATVTAACGKATLTMVLVHIAVQRVRLLGDIRQLAEDRQAGLVIFGHSHQPFLGKDGPFALFNPGAVGPPRFGLPTTLGVIDITKSSVDFAHFDVPTGQRWLPGENV
jgi:predicted phosphodiesterase